MRINHLFQSIIFALGFLPLALFAQNNLQNIRGVVVDKLSQSLLVGASVQILLESENKGTATDENGQYTLPDLAPDRYEIKVSYLGYKDVFVPNVVVTFGKEIILDIAMEEDLKLLDEVVVKAYSKSIEVLGKFDTVKSVKEAFIKGLRVDLLSLDIHLADGAGFDLLSDTSITTPIIFTTAYDDYAIRAFKHNSIDYLLKPIHINDLRFALDKYARRYHVIPQNVIEQLKSTYQSTQNQYKKRFMVRLGQNIETINADQIHHFDSRESMTFLQTFAGQRFMIDYSLDQLETLLPPGDFFRINRKVILHVSGIIKVSTHLNGRLAVAAKFLEGDARIVSRERVNDFKSWMDDIV